jgi:hypothetical protein
MTEVPPRYRVGNIIYVSFGRLPVSIRSQGRMQPSDHLSSLWQTSEAAYLKAVDTPEELTSESRAALILALRKLLELEKDGDRCVLLALRLATVERQMASMHCSEKPDAKRFYAEQSLAQLESILDYFAGDVHTIEDVDQRVLVPTAIYLRMVEAHLLLDDDRSALNCMESAEQSLGRVRFEGIEQVKITLRQQIIQLRQLS